MTKMLTTFACLLLSTATVALANDGTALEKAQAALSAATNAMYQDESGDRRLAAYGMAYEWQKPATQGKAGAIFSDMKVNHVFTRRLTTGDFRQDLLVGFDSKANMRFAVMHGGISDSCEALATKTISLSIAARGATLDLTGGAPRPYAAGTDKGCYVQIVANAFKLREAINQAPDASLFFNLTVDGTTYPVVYKSGGSSAKFYQTADVIVARQNLALVNPR